MPLQAGQTIAGFRIEKLLGEGGMGEVYLATELSLDRRVVIKTLLASLHGNADATARFEREAKLLAKVAHDYILKIHGYGVTQDGVAWMALDYVEGGDMRKGLETSPLPKGEGLAVLAKVAAAVEHAHKRGVIHRDLKPANILRGEGDRIYVADFGIAHLVETATRLTKAGDAPGSSLWIAPEQALV